MIRGVPVQFFPACNALVTAAVAAAQVHDYEGEPVRVVDAEHLIALPLQAGGARRRERAWLLFETGAVDRKRLREVLTEVVPSAAVARRDLRDAPEARRAVSRDVPARGPFGNRRRQRRDD